MLLVYADESMSSPLSMNVKRLAQILKQGAEGQVGDSESRLEGASHSYWPLMAKLLVSDFSFEKAYEESMNLFQKSAAKFAAIDGSLDQNLLGGLAVFWAGAYAATGTISYFRDKAPQVKYDAGFVEKGHALASCVPIYVDSIPDVEPQAAASQSGSQTISRPMTEESIVDNSTIANWIMLFSELYLAYHLAKMNEFQIILLDRSLSGTHSSLLRDTAKRALWKRQCAMLGLKIDDIALDVQDLAIGRYYTPNQDGLLPPRGDYLRHAAIFLLSKANRSLSVREIAEQLKLKEDDRTKKLARYLKRAVEDGKYFEMANGEYSLLPRLSSSWQRIRKLVELFGERFFSSSNGNPLQMTDGAEPRWLTTLDLAFLCLFTLNLLIEVCRQHNILLIGITKDTTARDMIAHLIPVCSQQGIWPADIKHVSTTDRMLLQAMSLFHHDQVCVPWTTVEYDTAFQTILLDYEHRPGLVSGAVQNRIILEQLFVKSYVQLDKAKSDDLFRSNVLFIDRLYHPSEMAPTITLKHEYGGAVEEVEPILWRSNASGNRVQELVMISLKAMTHQSVPEVFGHNEPLYIADKVAKAQRNNASQMVKAMGHWLINHPKLRRYSFYMNTFRARRSEVESARGRAQ
jgi:hypothetical protein